MLSAEGRRHSTRQPAEIITSTVLDCKPVCSPLKKRETFPYLKTWALNLFAFSSFDHTFSCDLHTIIALLKGAYREGMSVNIHMIQSRRDFFEGGSQPRYKTDEGSFMIWQYITMCFKYKKNHVIINRHKATLFLIFITLMLTRGASLPSWSWCTWNHMAFYLRIYICILHFIPRLNNRTKDTTGSCCPCLWPNGTPMERHMSMYVLFISTTRPEPVRL